MRNLKRDLTQEGGTRRILKRRARGHAPPAKQIITMTDKDVVISTSMMTRIPENEFRHGEYLHVSDLLYKCMRKIALSEHLGEKIQAEKLWPGRAITFELGHAVQDYVTMLLKNSVPRQLYGNWVCPCTALQVPLTTWQRASEQRCQTCGQPPLRYKEVVVKNDQYMITGSVDILLMLEDHLYIGECKSIAKQSWENLRRPKPEHQLQALLYWWLMKEAGKPLWDKASVLYVNKEFMWSGSPFKEFVFTPSVVVDRLDDLFHEAQYLVDFRKTGTLPRRVMCDSLDSPDAKECQFKHICFQLEGS